MKIANDVFVNSTSEYGDPQINETSHSFRRNPFYDRQMSKFGSFKNPKASMTVACQPSSTSQSDK